MNQPAQPTRRQRGPLAAAVLVAVLACWWFARDRAPLPPALLPSAPAPTAPLQEDAEPAASTGTRAADREELPGAAGPADVGDGDGADPIEPPPTKVPERFRFEVRGKVVDRKRNRIHGASVRLWAPHRAVQTQVASDGNYHFEVEWTGDLDTVRIEAWADGFGVNEEQVGCGNVFAIAKSGVSRDVELGPGSTIVGRAVGPTGPVAGAFVTCWQLDGKRVGYFGYSDPEGRFTVKVSPGMPVGRVVVRHGVFGQGDAIVPPVRTRGVADVGDVVLASVSAVRGRLVAPSGRGLADVPIFLAVDGRSSFADGHGASTASLSTDAGGAFVANGLAVGSCLVTVHNAMLPAFSEIAGPWGANERTLVVDAARVHLTFEWNGAPVPPSVLDIEWLPVEGEPPSVGDARFFDDRFVPFDSVWNVRAQLGELARGEVRIEVGRREQVECVVRLQ